MDCVDCERVNTLVEVAVPSRVKDACDEGKTRRPRRQTGLISPQIGAKEVYKVE